jgi:hypothetical protein
MPLPPAPARLPFRRYRVEERAAGLVDLIIGLADTPEPFRYLLALRAVELFVSWTPLDLVVVERGTDAVILPRTVDQRSDSC